MIDTSGFMTIFNLEAKVTGSDGQESYGELLQFERKDVWDIKWAEVAIFLAASTNKDIYVNIYACGSGSIFLSLSVSISTQKYKSVIFGGKLIDEKNFCLPYVYLI